MPLGNGAMWNQVYSSHNFCLWGLGSCRILAVIQFVLDGVFLVGLGCKCCSVLAAIVYEWLMPKSRFQVNAIIPEKL